MDEAILIREFKEGDAEARKIIYEMHYQPLLEYAWHLTSDEMMAEDIVQESFVKLYGKKDQEYKELHDLKGLRSLLYRITRNGCFDYLRKVKRENKGMNEFRWLSSEIELENALNDETEHAQLVDKIMSAIRKQSGQRRQVLDYMVENKNANEISTLMGIHRSGVYKHRDAFIEYLQKVEGIDAKDVSMLFKL